MKSVLRSNKFKEKKKLVTEERKEKRVGVTIRLK
jgi:hypothetical protein